MFAGKGIGGVGFGACFTAALRLVCTLDALCRALP